MPYQATMSDGPRQSSARDRGVRAMVPRLWVVAVAASVLGVVVAAAAAEQASIVAAITALLAAGGVLAGIRLHLPHGRRSWLAWRREPWLRVCTGLVMFSMADLLAWTAATGVLVETAARALGFAFVMAAGWSLVRERSRGAGADVLFDAGIAAALLVALGWLMWADAALADGEVSGSRLGGAGVATLAALMALGVVLKLLDVARPRILSFRALLLGAAALVAGELTADALLLTSSSAPDPWIVHFRVLGYGLLAAAALHPSLRTMYEPGTAQAGALRHRQVITLLAATSLGPAALALDAVGGRAPRLSAVAATSGALGVLAVAYLVHTVRQRSTVGELSLRDDLTALPNRTLFRDRVAMALADADRTGANVAVAVIDLDRFKNINDSLGQTGGNRVLAAVANRLVSAVPRGATVARMGGDEFAVLLPAVDGPAAVSALAAAVLAGVSEPLGVAKRELFLTASIGVALYPQDGEEADAVIRNADVAMYRAKDAGRNTCRHYTADMNARASERLALESGLHTALGRGEICLYYQPKVSLRSGRIVGMEALVRWNHPVLGVVPPDEFIPLAEESGVIVELGAWALAEACRQTKQWMDGGLPRLTVSVNLSARQFQQGGVEGVVARALRDSGLDPIQLELELTESLALQDPDAISASLRELKDIGIQCSVDDFGTGYSGLQYLTRFPIDKLKIDKAFVRNIGKSRDDARLVAGVIALAHGLELEVVAEGVETEEQLDFLTEHGCDLVQGYYYSPAVPAEEFEHLLVIQGAINPRASRRRREPSAC